MNFVELMIILSSMVFILPNVNRYENGENTKHCFISIIYCIRGN